MQLGVVVFGYYKHGGPMDLLGIGVVAFGYLVFGYFTARTKIDDCVTGCSLNPDLPIKAEQSCCGGEGEACWSDITANRKR